MMHTYRLTVRGFHCDLYGHVNNARYLEFLEAARWDFIGASPLEAMLGERGLAFVIAAISIEYKRPVGLGAEIEVRSEMARCTERRGTMRQEVYNLARNKIVAAAEVTFAVIEMATGRATVLDAEMRNALGVSTTDGSGDR